jgi:hypothetical protein
MKLTSAKFEWKLADLWIGVFWKRSNGLACKVLDVWICLLPCVPLHLRFYKDEA